MDFWLLAQRVGDKGIEKKKDRKGRWRGPGQSRMKCQVDFGACVCPCCAAPVYCSAVTVLVIPSTFFTDSLLPQYCYPHAICYISPANDILLLSYPPQTRYSTSYFPSAAETCHVLRIAYRIIIHPCRLSHARLLVYIYRNVIVAIPSVDRAHTYDVSTRCLHTCLTPSHSSGPNHVKHSCESVMAMVMMDGMEFHPADVPLTTF